MAKDDIKGAGDIISTGRAQTSGGSLEQNTNFGTVSNKANSTGPQGVNHIDNTQNIDNVAYNVPKSTDASGPAKPGSEGGQSIRVPQV